MLRILSVLLLVLSAPTAPAQTHGHAHSASELVPRAGAPSAEISGFTLDVADGWRITREQGGRRPMVQLQPTPPADGVQVSALVLSIPTWTDRTEVGPSVAENFGLIDLDASWTEVAVGADSASVRAFDAPPEAPAARAAILALESDGRVAVVFVSTSEDWAPERLRAAAVEVAAGLRRAAPPATY